MDNRIEVMIPKQYAELLLRVAAEREMPVEELLEQILRNYMERRDYNAD